MAWKNIPEKKVLATLKDGKEFKGTASEKMTIYVDGGVPGGGGDVQGVTVTVDPNTYVMTTQLKDGEGGNVGSPATVDLPLESMVVSGEYDDENKSIILTLKNGQTVTFSVADLVSGLQTEITSGNPLNADLIDDSSSNQKLVTDGEKQALGEITQNDVGEYTRFKYSNSNQTSFVNGQEDEYFTVYPLNNGDDPMDSYGFSIDANGYGLTLTRGESGYIYSYGESVTAGMLPVGIYEFDPQEGSQFFIDDNEEFEIATAGNIIISPTNDNNQMSVYLIPADGSQPMTYAYDKTSGTVTENAGVNTDDLDEVWNAIGDKADSSDVGDISDLHTTDTSSIVNAINELVGGGSGGGGVLTLYMLDPFNSYPPEVGDHLEFCRDKELTDPITATELDAALNEGKAVQINCLYNAGDDWGPNYVTITDFYDDGSYGSYMLFTLRSSNVDAGYRVNFRGDNNYATVVEIQTYNIQADWNEAYDNSSAFIKNKPTIPSKVSDLTNDAGYQNASQVSSAIAGAVGGITSFEYRVVQALPVTGEKGVIYLVANSGTTPNIYDEYIWVNNIFEKIGTTDIDLSGYATTQDLEDGLSGKADAIDPSDLPSGSTQNGVITTSDHTDIDPSVVDEGQIVVDSTDGKVYIVSEITTDPQTGDPIIVWKEIQTDKEVIYANMTVTDVQAMTFTVSGYTAYDICVLLDAGVNVIYRLNLPQALPGLAAGVYDFRPIMHVSSGGYGGVMSSMIGPSGSSTILGIATHADSETSHFEMRYLQNKIDSNNKLSADLIDSSTSDEKTYQTGTGAPTTSTTGSVGEIYVDKSTGTVYVCTSTTGGTYTWVEVSGTQVQVDWGQSDSTAVDYIKNKPTIPTVNDATLTIQKNGTTVQTFTANSSANKTANIEVPVITMQTTDPGEGVALAANHFIAVYEA